MNTDELKFTIGERLVQLREKFGLSQAQVASTIGVDRTSYAKYEKNVNKPTRKLKELSELFHVTTDYIMCLSEHPYGAPFAGQDNGNFLVFDYQIFAIRLKNLCQKNNISQEQLEKISGVSLQVIEDWEFSKRTPDAPTLSKLANYFNVSVDYLLGRTDEPGGTANITGGTNKEKSSPLYSHEERWIESDLEDMLQSAAIHKEDNDAIMFATLLKSVLMQAEKLSFKTYKAHITEKKQDTNPNINESVTNTFTKSGLRLRPYIDVALSGPLHDIERKDCYRVLTNHKAHQFITDVIDQMEKYHTGMEPFDDEPIYHNIANEIMYEPSRFLSAFVNNGAPGREMLIKKLRNKFK